MQDPNKIRGNLDQGGHTSISATTLAAPPTYSTQPTTTG